MKSTLICTALALISITGQAANAQGLIDQFNAEQSQLQRQQLEHTKKCNMMRDEAQYSSLNNRNIVYRVARGDLYMIRWTEFVSHNLVEKPCQIRYIGRMNTDMVTCKDARYCVVGAQSRYVVEGSELVVYTNNTHFGLDKLPPVVRRVIGRTR